MSQWGGKIRMNKRRKLTNDIKKGVKFLEVIRDEYSWVHVSNLNVHYVAFYEESIQRHSCVFWRDRVFGKSVLHILIGKRMTINLFDVINHQNLVVLVLKKDKTYIKSSFSFADLSMYLHYPKFQVCICIALNSLLYVSQPPQKSKGWLEK